MIRRVDAPRVHGAWTADWFAGDPALGELFGPASTLDALAAHAPRLRPAPGWPDLLEPDPRGAPDPTALLVLAGQQPVLAGGPALVAHKAATAVALAHDLAARLERPVEPVFLLATQDADSTEIDHVDLLDDAGRLLRLRCPVLPENEMFARARWEPRGLARAFRRLAARAPACAPLLDELLAASANDAPVADHVIGLLRATLGRAGLRFVQAHRLAEAGRPVLDAHLADPRAARGALAAGAERLRARGLPVAFDPDDPRPLALESRAGRRRRLEPDDGGARARLAARPDDFSPHAALRPVVQAAALPVVAQVAGPSELLYLAQARGLHELHDARPPLLVPRLEATRVEPAQLADLAPDFRLAPDAEAHRAERTQVLDAARRFADRLRADEPRLAARLDRWQRRLQRDLARLAAQPFWKGRHRGRAAQTLTPRGRPQDAVLAWLPDAWAHGEPGPWVAQLLEMARGHEPPVHVFHHLEA